MVTCSKSPGCEKGEELQHIAQRRRPNPVATMSDPKERATVVDLNSMKNQKSSQDKEDPKRGPRKTPKNPRTREKPKKENEKPNE